jgi:LysM repeat protein
VAVASLALVAAAIVLFFIGPMLLGIGGKDKSSASPSPIATAAATPTPLPTEPPGPTATVYIVVKNDTAIRIAAKFGITLEQLVAANPQVKPPKYVIQEGQQLVIPVPIATSVQGVEGASAAP